MIQMELTERAKNHFFSLFTRNPGLKGIALALEKAGCAGYQYKTDLLYDIPGHVNKIVVQGVNFYVPTTSLMRLSGVVIDCVRDGLLETKLTFNNPNVSMACGCGESVELLESVG